MAKIQIVVKSLLILILVLAAVLLSACMREPEVCNYNKVCETNETDNCIDCQSTLGRDIPLPTGHVVLELGENQS